MALNRKMSPGTQIQTGLVFLIVAGLTKYFLKPGTAGLSDGWTDGIVGALYGASIAFMLLGIWRKRSIKAQSA